jgi:Fic family protein
MNTAMLNSSAFAFVFVHPFEDGNGRIHRFLIHHVLSRRGFGAPGFIFPVSAAMLRDRDGYDSALEAFSRAIHPFVDWRFTPDREVEVRSDTLDLYRFFDATPQAQYLYERVIDTARHDLREELDFITTYDRALSAVREIVAMPDRRASLFVRLCLQNRGRLARAKRATFRDLTDTEVARLEAAVVAALAPGARGRRARVPRAARRA